VCGGGRGGLSGEAGAGAAAAGACAARAACRVRVPPPTPACLAAVSLLEPSAPRPRGPPPPPKPRSYVTLRLLGVEADAPEIVRAREWVSRRRLGPPWSARASAVGPRDLQCRALH
jgi:hypothetical protein